MGKILILPLLVLFITSCGGSKKANQIDEREGQTSKGTRLAAREQFLADLNLGEEQRESVQVIINDGFEKIQDIRKSGNDQSTKMQLMKDASEDTDNKLKLILDADQYLIYEEYKARQVERIRSQVRNKRRGQNNRF